MKTEINAIEKRQNNIEERAKLFNITNEEAAKITDYEQSLSDEIVATGVATSMSLEEMKKTIRKVTFKKNWESIKSRFINLGPAFMIRKHESRQQEIIDAKVETQKINQELLEKEKKEYFDKNVNIVLVTYDCIWSRDEGEEALRKAKLTVERNWSERQSSLSEFLTLQYTIARITM